MQTVAARGRKASTLSERRERIADGPSLVDFISGDVAPSAKSYKGKLKREPGESER